MAPKHPIPTDGYGPLGEGEMITNGTGGRRAYSRFSTDGEDCIDAEYRRHAFNLENGGNMFDDC